MKTHMASRIDQLTATVVACENDLSGSLKFEVRRRLASSFSGLEF